MSVDERLRHGLAHLAPADPSGAYERVVEKRVRRGLVRRAQSGVLAFAVALGTLGGIWALARGPGPGDGDTTGGPPLVDGAIATVLYTSPFTGTGDAVRTGFELALVSPEDGSIVPLTSGTRILADPAWSPDGSTIVFWLVTDDRDSPPGLYKIGPEGGDPSLLLETDLSIGTISWSPDGDRIAFVGITPADGTELDMPSAIYTVAADGSDLQQLPIEGHVREVAWSPDGTRLAVMKLYAVGGDRIGQDIYVVDLVTGDERRLTDNGTAWKPAWSPDGTQMAFTSSETGKVGDGDLYVINVDGSGRVRLTTSPGLEESTSWSPDGSTIAVVRYRTTGRSDCDIVLVAPDGSSERMLLDGPVDGACPIGVAWQPVPKTAGPPAPSETPASTGPTGPTSTDTPTELSGVGPVCDLSSVRGDFGGSGDLGTAYVYAEPDEAGGCLPGGAGVHRLGIDLGAGRVELMSDPLECGLAGCSAFAAPDIDGDGRAEIAVRVPSSGVPWNFVALYRVTGSADGSDGGPALEPIEVARTADAKGASFVAAFGGPGPTLLPWGGNAAQRAGGFCLPATTGHDAGPARLSWWVATSEGQDRWHVVNPTFDASGDQLVAMGVGDYLVPDQVRSLPAGGGDTFCGAPVVG